MKKCELCKSAAKAYCESDQASLCWDCDAKVHAANFLVARHSRTLLCNICQSATPWQAAGAKLGHTVSVCESCAKSGREIDEDDHYAAEDDGDDEETDEDEAEDQKDGGENQVVPMTCTTPPPPPAMSCSSSDGSSASGFSSVKRMRDQIKVGENQVVPMTCTTPPPPPAMSCSSSDGSSASGFSSVKRMRDQENIYCSNPHRKLTRTGSEDSFQQPLKDQRIEPVRSSGSTAKRHDHEHCHRDKGILTGESGAIDLNLPASPSH